MPKQKINIKALSKSNKKTTPIVCCSISGGVFLLFILISLIVLFFSFFKHPLPSPTIPQNLPDISPKTIEPEQQQSQTYRISENLILKNTGTTDSYLQTIYIAKFHDYQPYQDVLEETISPIGYEIVTDQYNNEFLKYTFHNLAPNETRNLNFEYKMQINSVKFDLSSCQGQSINDYLSPEQYIESDNPEIINLAQQITQNSANQCQASKSIYNWVADNISYPQYFSYANGALWALQNRQGDCTEFADLFVALNRAIGIPARFVEGLTYASDQETEASNMKHDWAQVYLPNIGWMPVDPTFGRSPSQRDRYFAALPANHAFLTIGQNLEILNNYYFYYYEYNGSTVETAQENWRMQKAN